MKYLVGAVLSVMLLASCSHAEPEPSTAAFPSIDTTGLSQTQSDIVELTKTEFEAQPPGTKYSEGITEPWCADFVSWIYKEAGHPLKNPNSGSWRIPGTYTLREYYEARGDFRPVDSGYEPQLGDVAIYEDSPVFGDHTNIVLTVNNEVITSIGGNENGVIRVYENTERNYEGLLGYGVMNSSADTPANQAE